MEATVKGVRKMGKHVSVHATHAASVPPPYQLAIEEPEFHMTVLEDHTVRDHDAGCAVLPPTWFSVTVTSPVQKRYLYLVQKETGTGLVVVILLYDRTTAPSDGDDGGGGLRLPPSGAWLRAVVDGAVYVLASDLVLSRKAITAWIGGDEPPTTPARPPYT